MSMSSDVTISVRDLVKNHGDLEILKGLCVDVSRGEVAVIVGPSGGGKSTFLRCLNGLERFQAGSVRIEEITLTSHDDEKTRESTLCDIRRKIGMVFQGFHLFPHLSVLRNVTEAPICVRKESRETAEARAIALLDRVGLKAKLHARPSQLSGGQQQRVAIARTLAMEPSAILFDEPTSALDPRMTGEVLAVMSDLARDGQTMIVVTHAMAFARQVANTVYVFDGGRIAESGPPEQIFHAPTTEAARLFLAETSAA